MKHFPVGIIAREESEFPPFGKQSFFFEEMADASVDLPTEIFVFSPLRWDGSKEIYGFKFVSDKWVPCKELIPKMLYDRFTAKAPGELEAYLRFRAFLLENQHRFTTPLPLVELTRNKVQFHDFLRIRQFSTLEAIPLHQATKAHLHQFWQKNTTVYIKPIIGSNGANIATIELTEKKTCLLRRADGAETIQVEKALDGLKRIFPKDEFFIQPKANLISFDQRAYDVRVLIQNHGRADYRVTGLGVRFGEKGSWVSNISAGGYALPIFHLQERLADMGRDVVEVEKEIKTACLACTQLLHQTYGPFAEMAYDILLTSDQGPVFLEANAKPARWIFTVMADALTDRPEEAAYYREIRRLSVRMPLVYASSN